MMPIDPEVLEALRGVEDPEIGVSIVDLGLIYSAWREGGTVHLRMTMTSPACPLGGLITEDAEAALRCRLPGVNDVDVELIFDPPWDPNRVTAAGRAQLGWSESPDA